MWEVAQPDSRQDGGLNIDERHLETSQAGHDHTDLVEGTGLDKEEHSTFGNMEDLFITWTPELSSSKKTDYCIMCLLRKHHQTICDKKHQTGQQSNKRFSGASTSVSGEGVSVVNKLHWSRVDSNGVAEEEVVEANWGNRAASQECASVFNIELRMWAWEARLERSGEGENLLCVQYKKIIPLQVQLFH